ncbi:MAG TPA: hypothetical protein VMH33_07480 [Solirubrobacterales bacterium]|nr:hypothetical protein [Solirubrobacterales bacterium]
MPPDRRMISMPRIHRPHVVILVGLACLCLAASATARPSAGAHRADLTDYNAHTYGPNFAGCLPQSNSFPGREITADAPSNWTCGRLRRLWRHADGTDGEFLTFRLFGHRWQCPIVARPDHRQHTTLGCFHVHWKTDYEGKRPPGKPVVRFFLPYPAG